jgi:cell division protein FtsZ
MERRPAVYRKGSGAGSVASDKSDENDLDYLDIPAFLRRQAD